MLSDAKSFFWSATNVIATVNNTISNALEQLDSEMEQNENDSKVQQESDLEIYKRMLEDAQMQQFELSKQSRMLLSEKEAEVAFWKGKCSLSDNPSDEISDSLALMKIKSEKHELEKSLLEMEGKLRNVVNLELDYSMLQKKLNDITSRYSAVREDFSSYKAEMEAKEKGRIETIDNLVSEYSQLAADAELNQTKTLKRNAEILLENETLSTKIHALEHSISELADRSVSQKQTDSSASFSSINLELREARTKVVNLQFDLKEKDEELFRLQKELKIARQNQQSGTTPSAAASPSRASSSSSSSVRDVDADTSEDNQVQLQQAVQRYKIEVANLQQDVARLVVEKREAEDAGRKYMERAKSLQREVAASSSSSTTSVTTAAAVSPPSPGRVGDASNTAIVVVPTATAVLCDANAVAELQSALSAAQQQIVDMQLAHAAELAAATNRLSAAAINADSSASTQRLLLEEEVAKLTAQLSQEKVAHASFLAVTEEKERQVLLRLENEAAQRLDIASSSSAEAIRVMREQLESAHSVELQRQSALLASTQAQVAHMTSELASSQLEVQRMQAQQLRASTDASNGMEVAQRELREEREQLQSVRSALAICEEKNATLRLELVSAQATLDQERAAALLGNNDVAAKMVAREEELRTLAAVHEKEVIAQLQHTHAESMAHANATAASHLEEQLQNLRLSLESARIAGEEALRRELQRQHSELLAAKDASHAEMMVALRAGLQKESADELEVQRAMWHSKQEEALNALSASKDRELVAKISDVTLSLRVEHQVAMSQAEQRASAAAAELQNAHAVQLAALHVDIQSLRTELTGVEAK
jgi:hypothetical protein